MKKTKTAIGTAATPATVPSILTSPWGAKTILDFCEWAGISRSKAYREFKSGRLTKKKAGRRTLITYEAAHRWLESLPQGGGRNATEVP